MPLVSFDNWLVHFELGRLGFQRRRHTEAEKYLSIAERTAPAAFRFPVQSLRFSNLTGLGDTIDIDMNPETIEVGKAALKAPGREEHQLSIRTWLGRLGGYVGLLDPVLRSSMEYELGLAHKIRGSIPDAVTYWCRCNASGYTPRAFHELLRIFASYCFEKTAGRLAAIAALESDESFFDLWELAKAIAGTLEDQPVGRLSGDLLGKLLVAVEARMEE